MIVELKQWTEVGRSNVTDCVTIDYGGRARDTLHPSRQVAQYQRYLLDTHPAFGDDPAISLDACAYLHNAQRDPKSPLNLPEFASLMATNPAFTGSERSALIDFLEARVVGPDDGSILDRVASTAFRPHKRLLDHVARVIKQRAGLHAPRRTAGRLQRDHGFGPVGRPEPAEGRVHRRGRARDREVGHRGQPRGRAVRARPADAAPAPARRPSPRTCARSSARGPARCSSTSATRRPSTSRSTSSSSTRRIASGRSARAASRPEGAHRQGPDRRHPRRQPRHGLLHRRPAGRAPGRGRQHGPDPRVGRQARPRGPRVRARGAVPLERLRRVHQVGRQHARAGANAAGPLADGRRLRLPDRRLGRPARAADPSARQGRGRPRGSSPASAGRGRTPTPTASSCPTSGSGTGRCPGTPGTASGRSAPASRSPTSGRATPEGIDQVGCVYTAQGFEFDYVGVIFGPDLVYRTIDGGWVGQRDQSHDRVVRRGVTEQEFTDFVKSTYRVLLTRGLRGCYVYFMDAPTRDFVLSRCERILPAALNAAQTAREFEPTE